MYCVLNFRKAINSDYHTQYLASFIVSVGYFLEVITRLTNLRLLKTIPGVFFQGMHYGWSSSSVPKLTQNSITHDEAQYITQMFTYGSIAYSIISFADYPRLSHKFGVAASVVVMTVSWVLIALSDSAMVFMIARFFAGAGRGMAYQISVNYICEIADPEIRGFLGCLVFVMTNLGVLVIYSLGTNLEIVYSSTIGAIISLTELAALKLVPESPYILLLRGKIRNARSVLRRLRNLWNVEDELEKVGQMVKTQDEENSNIFSVFTVASNRKAFWIITILNTFQAFSGINISVRQILKLSGGNLESYRIAIVSSITVVLSCILTALFVDCVGRRTILIISFSGSSISLLVLSLFSYVHQTSHIPKSLTLTPLLCLITYTMFYRMGIGTIPLLLTGELFPMNAKNTASCLMGLWSVIVHFAAIKIMDCVSENCAVFFVYCLYAGCCLVGVFYTYVFVPETKGKSLEAIQSCLKMNNC